MRFKNVISEASVDGTFKTIMKKGSKESIIYFNKSIKLGFNNKVSEYSNHPSYMGGIESDDGEQISPELALKQIKDKLDIEDKRDGKGLDRFNKIKFSLKRYLEDAKEAGKYEGYN